MSFALKSGLLVLLFAVASPIVGSFQANMVLRDGMQKRKTCLDAGRRSLLAGLGGLVLGQLSRPTEALATPVRAPLPRVWIPPGPRSLIFRLVSLLFTVFPG